MNRLFLTGILIIIWGCEKNVEQKPVNIELPEKCNVSINTENMFFILPNNSKIQLDYFGDMNVEQYATGTRIVKITFNPKKLSNALKKATDEYKKNYPNFNFSYRISISNKINDNTPMAFVEKYESGVSGTGIDQLFNLDKDKLTWDDLIRLGGGTPASLREVISLSKGENINIILYGVQVDPTTKNPEYWPRNELQIEKYCN